MSALEAIVKNVEDTAMQDGEEIIEEVIEEEQVDWIGPSEDMDQVPQEYYQNDLLVHQLVDYDDPDSYQSFLPVRNGDAYFSLNLPDLLSKPYQFTQETGAVVRMVSCFNKKCLRQVAWSGYLYTIKDYFSENTWNHWRCINENCFGEVRTTPDYTDVRETQSHGDNCNPDELQIAVRIAIYDARLLAEFTETPLENLYFGAVVRIKTDYPGATGLFPPYEIVKSTLEDHRHNKIYRKRFEMQKFRDKQKKMNMTPDEVLFAENTSGLVKFRRTKPFPVSMCNECNDQFMSTNLPSQDQLISHYMYTHNRRLTIERFEFKDLNSFDQYIRELNTNCRYKMKKMGLADENMYYLCAHDDRLAKTGIGRATRLQQQNCHCTAFIRVFDWRIVSKREGARITIDYCLEHQPHMYEPEMPYSSRSLRANTTGSIPPGAYQKDYIDYYTPEVFQRDMEDRRIRSQKIMLGEITLGLPDRTPTKRPVEAKSYLPPGRLKASFGARSLAPPLAAQIAAGSTQPYVDSYGDVESPTRQRMNNRQSIRNFQKREELEEVVQSEPSTSVEDTRIDDPPPRIYITQKPFTRLTERQNFKDIYTFNAVCKVEDACLSLLNRLQSCQHARVGLGYREKLNIILRRANTDPGLTDGSTADDINRSWVLEKPVRGRPRKRTRLDGEDEVVEDDDEDMDIDEVHEEDEHQTKNIEVAKEEIKKEPIISPDSPKPSTSSEVPSVELPEAVESTSSRITQETTTRSVRARKPPARLLEND